MMAGEDPDTRFAWARVGVAELERRPIGRGDAAARDFRGEPERDRSLILAPAGVVWTEWSRAVAVHGPSECEYRVRRHDGAYRDFAVRVAPLVAADGVVRDWADVPTERSPCNWRRSSVNDSCLTKVTLPDQKASL